LVWIPPSQSLSKRLEVEDFPQKDVQDAIPALAAQPFLAEIRGAKAQAVAEGKAETKAEAKEKDKK
jgi:hypothetical protein